MNKRRIMLAAGALVLAGAGLAPVWLKQPPRRAILIGAAGAMKELLALQAAQFMQQHPEVDITIEPGDSLQAWLALVGGSIDIAAMVRNLSLDEENENLYQAMIAREYIAIIVHPKSEVVNLSQQQVYDLLSGQIQNWQYAGGPVAPVHVISRIQESTTRRFVEARILRGGHVSNQAIEVATAQQMLEQVAADPHALGFIALKDLNAQSQNPNQDQFRQLKIDGVAISNKRVLTGRYPYTRSLYLLRESQQSGLAAAFIEFACSPAGQKIVVEQGLIPVHAIL